MHPQQTSTCKNRLRLCPMCIYIYVYMNIHVRVTHTHIYIYKYMNICIHNKISTRQHLLRMRPLNYVYIYKFVYTCNELHSRLTKSLELYIIQIRVTNSTVGLYIRVTNSTVGSQNLSNSVSSKYVSRTLQSVCIYVSRTLLSAHKISRSLCHLNFTNSIASTHTHTHLHIYIYMYLHQIQHT